MSNEDWIEKYRSKVMTAEGAVRNIQAGSHIFIGTGCGEPQALVHALAHVAWLSKSRPHCSIQEAHLVAFV